MMDKKDNVKQTTYGYEITWVSEDHIEIVVGVL